MDKYLETKFDSRFREIANLQWLPYVGKDYTLVPENQQLLIVGESHYVPIDEEPSFYEDETWSRQFILIAGLKNPGWFKDHTINPLVRNIEKAILNNNTITNENKKKIWESSSYFNLVQALLSSRQKRPNLDNFKQGWDVFFKIITILKPRHALFCGVGGANNDLFIEAAQKNGFTTKRIVVREKIGSAYPRAASIAN